MALPTGSEWTKLLSGAGIDPKSAAEYATSFVLEKMTQDSLNMLDRDMLKEMGVTALGDALAILRLGKSTGAAAAAAPSAAATTVTTRSSIG